MPFYSSVANKQTRAICNKHLLWWAKISGSKYLDPCISYLNINATSNASTRPRIRIVEDT